MKKLIPSIFMVLSMISLHSCSFVPKEDRHVDVSTLEELIDAGKVTRVEVLDSTVMHTIEMLSDSLYYSKRQLHFFQESNKGDQKAATNYSIGNEYQLKNIYNGKTYVRDTVDSDSKMLMDNNWNIIAGDFLYTSPGYAKQQVDRTISQSGFVAIEERAITLKNVLPEFDESVVDKWTNGRLPSFRKTYYYELEGHKFKSSGSECYRINSNPKYFYHARLGILKMK